MSFGRSGIKTKKNMKPPWKYTDRENIYNRRETYPIAALFTQYPHSLVRNRNVASAVKSWISTACHSNAIRPEIYLNDIKINFLAHRERIRIPLHGPTSNVVQGNNSCLFSETYNTHEYTLSTN